MEAEISQVVPIRRLALALALALAAPVTARAQTVAQAAEGLGFAPANFKIFSTKTGKLVGHAHYEVEEVAGKIFIHGVSRYLDGEYDVEKDQIAVAKGMPILLECRHSFFYPDGKLKRESHADMRSGFASCIRRSRNGKEWVQSDELDFPADTYAGASVMARIQHYLRRGGRGRAVLSLHDFDCTPSPRVIAFEIQVRPGEKRWTRYTAASLVKVELKPNFGFFTFILIPFIPRITVWFDPRDRWQFVGGDFARYYEGPLITLVKVPGAARPIESAAPPAHRKPRSNASPSPGH